jgi:hypothetical protein
MRISAAALLAIALTGPVSAGALVDAVDLCSDPLTTGPEKLERLPMAGWTQELDPASVPLLDLATANIIGFTIGMENLEERFAAAPVLAGNLERMALDGQITLWTRDGAVLAVGIGPTAEGGEHLACYFAGPPTSELDDIQASYGGPEILPELELIALRFDETAIRYDPEITYKMFSNWTRLTSDPARTGLTDGYRLERVQQP